MKQATLIQNLKDLIAYLEARDFGDQDIFAPSFVMRAETPAAFRDLCRKFGAFTKSASDGYFNVHKWFGEIKFEAYIYREMVCKRIEVGEKIIPGEPERIIPATEARIEKVYEFQCPDTVLGLGDASGDPMESGEVIDAKLLEAEIMADHGPEMSGVPF